MIMHAYNDDMNESVNLDNSNDTLLILRNLRCKNNRLLIGHLKKIL